MLCSRASPRAELVPCRAPSEHSPPVARLSPTVVGTLETCENGWCLMQVKTFTGWVKETYLWGALKS